MAVIVTDIKICDGPIIKENDMVEFYYRVFTKDGKEIESTYSPDIPITLKLSPLCMLKGLFQGMSGMRTGGSLRKIEISADDAFGQRGWQKIPANSDLIVEVCVSRIIYNTN